MFGKGPRLGYQVVLASVLAIALFWSDQYANYWQSVRSFVMAMTSPIHYVVGAPVQAWRWVALNAKSQQKILEDNARLRAHEILLESKVQRLLVLERENAQLRALNHSAENITDRVKVAQLLAVSLDPLLNQWVVNVGTSADVYIGQPVLDAYGVVGQVVSVASHISRVLLLVDKRSAVPVKNMRNGERAVLVGRGVGRELSLIHVSKIADVKVGDRYLTSGLALHYPAGYPAARVVSVSKEPGESFLQVRLKPAAHLAQSHQLLLAWPKQQHLQAHVHAMLRKPLAGGRK